jgi:hypothetical protein
MSLPSENPAYACQADVKQVVDINSDDSFNQNANQIAISSISNDEPLVTRRELWSYYCAFRYTGFLLVIPLTKLNISVL